VQRLQSIIIQTYQC